MHLIESSDAPAWAGMAEALAGVGYWRMEAASQRIQWSENMYRIFGFASDATPSLEVAMDRVHPDDRASADQNLSQDVAGQSSRQRHPVRIVWPSGEIRHIEGSTHTVKDSDGTVVAVVGAVLDVTDRERAASELLRSKERAEQAAADKCAFVANVTHELRTPLTAIIGYADLLREGVAPDPRRLALMKGAGRTLLSIVNNILDYSRIEEGRAVMTPQACSPRAIGTECMDLFAAGAEERGLVLKLDAAADLPELVMIDPDGLRQVLVNLIGNAVKYTEKGWVSLSLRHEANELCVAVEDSGTGIHPAEMDFVFERYARSRLRPGASTGAGLGLSICKGLVAAMGGMITATSPPGFGAKFAFTISAPPDDATARQPFVPPLSHVRVLVADDNDIVREITRCILESAGAGVTEAKDGLSAIALAGATTFDVLLVDLNMPGLSGFEVVKRLRAPGSTCRAAIYAFTASGGTTESSVRVAGFDGLFSKPIDPGNLLSRVHRAASLERAA
jgi:PAS domain S-box-containing protein